MFRNLRTGTKLVILCSVFCVAIAVPIFSGVIEKQIAIDFARKELTGSRHLAVLRAAYIAILPCEIGSAGSPDLCKAPFDQVIDRLASARMDFGEDLQSADLKRSLVATLRQLSSTKNGGILWSTYAVAALTTARDLASRIGDSYNLVFDTGLDSYHLQDIVTAKFPALMGQLGEMQVLVREASAAGGPSGEHKVRLLMLDGLLRSAISEVKRDLAAAYRADNDGRLKRALDPPVAEMVRSTGLYLNTISANFVEGKALPVDAGYLAELFRSAVQSNLDAWASDHAELDRLLGDRIAELLARMRRDLLLTGALALLSVLLAIITHRSIVPPLRRLAGIAKEVSETRNYELRIKDVARDEVGQLGAAFNNMLSELAVARDREHAAQGELARVSRMTTAGAMTASIAHEINQPLGAIVSNGNAGLRWLRKAPPNLGEVELALNDIVSDGKRASELIRSIRSMFKTDDQARTLVDVNGMIQQTLRLVQGELRSTGMLVKLELDDKLPPVSGSQVQLQHVFLNLIMNAKEAMAPVADRARVLRIRSSIEATQDVVVTVEDNGPGIAREQDARVFEPFFTTKREGMGMGLSICRTIVEAHNGRIWASPSSPHGSIFHVALPASGSSQRVEVSTDSRDE